MSNFTRPYFLMVSRPVADASAKWAPQFGDFSRADVAAEMRDASAGQRWRPRVEREAFKIIRAANASRVACEAAVAELNASA